MNKGFSSLIKISSIKIVRTTFLFIGLLSSSHLFAQQSPLQLKETHLQTSQTNKETNNSSSSLLKETRQILQLAEYIGVDYPAAVNHRQISNKDEFAEMQQFANIIVDKISGLPVNNNQLIRLSIALQQAVNNKENTASIQKYSQAIRQQILAISPVLVLPKHLLPSKQTQALFVENCALCHGETGQGNGNLARTLSPKPTDFTDQSRALNRSLLGLYDAITNGLEGSAMRSFNNLSERQRWSLAFYVGGLAFKPTSDVDKVSSSQSLPNINLTNWINNNPNNLMQKKFIIAGTNK